VELSFKEATQDDLELMMAWRSHPLVYKGLYVQKAPLTWEEHLNWWKGRKNRKDWIISVTGSRRVGSVNVSSLDTETPEVGIYIGEVTSQSKGIGTFAILWACQWLKQKEYKQAKASILEDNAASVKAFENAGFVLNGDGRLGEKIYIRSFKRG
jgi:RimJ/RimL family protein N-acetyltransferase